jgi:Na+-driven multidrug efflux pump
MQASDVMSCRTDELSLPDTCSRESRDAAVGFSAIAAAAIESRQHKEANQQPGGQLAGLASRTLMLLETPIAPTIMWLAIPNATVMIVQVLIGLLEVYFISRLGVDALAGVAPVFPLV